MTRLELLRCLESLDSSRQSKFSSYPPVTLLESRIHRLISLDFEAFGKSFSTRLELLCCLESLEGSRLS